MNDFCLLLNMKATWEYTRTFIKITYLVNVWVLYSAGITDSRSVAWSYGDVLF
jgi:hypothetical protein